MIDKNTYEADITFPVVSINSLIGHDKDGLSVALSVELVHKFTEYERETIWHQRTHSLTELSISANVGGNSAGAYGGQCPEVLLEMKDSVLSVDELKKLKDIWDRWHLNDMHGECIHQDKAAHCAEVGGWLQGDEWTKMVEEQTAKCPIRYSYGSKWLVEPLPFEVVRFIQGLARKLGSI